jgi:hypothetical protein
MSENYLSVTDRKNIEYYKSLVCAFLATSLVVDLIIVVASLFAIFSDKDNLAASVFFVSFFSCFLALVLNKNYLVKMIVSLNSCEEYTSEVFRIDFVLKMLDFIGRGFFIFGVAYLAFGFLDI